MTTNQYIQHIRAPELIDAEKDLQKFRTAIHHLKGANRMGQEADQARVILAIYKGYLEATLDLIGDDAIINVPNIPEDSEIGKAWDEFLAWRDAQQEGVL